jgi:hypothetical protein
MSRAKVADGQSDGLTDGQIGAFMLTLPVSGWFSSVKGIKDVTHMMILYL